MIFSVLYHNLFEFPLTEKELVKWESNKSNRCNESITNIISKDGYFFLKGREDLIKQRQNREKTSIKKLKIAHKASKILSKIPFVKMVAITGSLAMMNSSVDSDIDLMVVVRQNTLWMSRLVILVILFILDIPVRRSHDRIQRDKLCMNIWLDESDLIWKRSDRNIYTAHEIAQIIPLVNKDKTYEKFLYQNRWVLDFWPNSVKISNLKSQVSNKFKIIKFLNFKLLNLDIVLDLMLGFWNFIAFKMQYLYMKLKISREIVSKTRAIFHPIDWGKEVLKKLNGTL